MKKNLKYAVLIAMVASVAGPAFAGRNLTVEVSPRSVEEAFQIPNADRLPTSEMESLPGSVVSEYSFGSVIGHPKLFVPSLSGALIDSDARQDSYSFDNPETVTIASVRLLSQSSVMSASYSPTSQSLSPTSQSLSPTSQSLSPGSDASVGAPRFESPRRSLSSEYSRADVPTAWEVNS